MRHALSPARDAFAWARWLLAWEERNELHVPALLAVRRERMLASPYALFRGTPALFYELLRSEIGDPPFGYAGTIVGDMHIENVGAYRTDKRQVVFGINDFDHAGEGLWAYDVLRLACSVLLAGRTFGGTARNSLSLIERGLAVYRRGLAAKSVPRPDPTAGPTATLVGRASRRSARALLDQRVPKISGKRRFPRNGRYLPVPRPLRAHLPELLTAWLESLGPRAPKRAASMRVVTAAQRVAGIASLGVFRLALLVTDDDDELRIIELKEAVPSAIHPWPTRDKRAARAEAHDEARSHAERVVDAARTMVEKPPRRMCALPPVRVGRERIAFVGRSLMPQEDKLDIAKLHAWSDRLSLCSQIFALLASAHRRGAPDAGPYKLSDRQLEATLESAVLLTGKVESIALAYAHAFINGRGG